MPLAPKLLLAFPGKVQAGFAALKLPQSQEFPLLVPILHSSGAPIYSLVYQGKAPSHCVCPHPKGVALGPEIRTISPNFQEHGLWRDTHGPMLSEAWSSLFHLLCQPDLF